MTAAAAFAGGVLLGGTLGVLLMAMLYMLRDPEQKGDER